MQPSIRNDYNQRTRSKRFERLRRLEPMIVLRRKGGEAVERPERVERRILPLACCVLWRGLTIEKCGTKRAIGANAHGSTGDLRRSIV